ncbi:hypothetical protein Peur_032908 [Populus x canadensis]
MYIWTICFDLITNHKGPRITLVFHFLNKLEDILRPSNWEPSSINTVMVDIYIVINFIILHIKRLWTDVVGEVISEAQPYIYCLKGFWILPNPIPPEYQVKLQNFCC